MNKQLLVFICMLLWNIPLWSASRPLNEVTASDDLHVAITEEAISEETRDWIIQGQVVENVEPPYPLPGATVVIKGTTLGTTTDVNGYFSVKAKRGDILVFKFLGFQDYEYVVSRAISNLTVPLSPESQQLDEVVVTGLSEERKANSISSVSSLNVAQNAATKPITSLSQAFAGSVAGLFTSQGTSLPGKDETSIKLRGWTTLGDCEPLVLVDGIPMGMNDLDPNTVESITVLKDAAASAIYGARAANGVVIVKTKRGMPGKVNISYDGYYGIQKATYLPKFVNAAQYMDMVNVAHESIGGSPLYSQEAIDATRNHVDPIKYPDTDWVDYMFGTGQIQSHSFSISGGSNLARFALTANYLDNQALTEKTSYQRLNIRANTTVNLLDNLSVDMDFQAIRGNRKDPMEAVFKYIYTTPPNTVIHYPMKEGTDIVFYGYRPEQSNPAARLERGGVNSYLEDNILINLSPRWEIIPNLIARGRFSYQVGSASTKKDREAYNFFDYNSGVYQQTWSAHHSASMYRSSYYYLGGTLEYTWEKNKHRLFTIAGYNQELTNDGGFDQWAMVSCFAKMNYTYNDKYLLEGTVRYDGSSRFGPGHKFGVFPSIGAGWNLHEESFLKPIMKFLNEFKLRASYGVLGNENIGLYRYQTLIDAGNSDEIIFGNPDITWESVYMLNIGADIRLFKDLSITLDFYDKLTKNVIVTPPISYIGGILSAPINAGEVRNRGWELDLNYSKRLLKDLDLNVHVGISQNKNKLEKMFGAPYDMGNRIHAVGHPLNSYYVYPTDGLLQENDFIKDAEGNLIPKEGIVIFDGQKPGDIHYVDTNDDEKITEKDRIIAGTDQPNLNYFANISLKYKKLDFGILFQGVTGTDAYYTGPYAYGLNTAGDGLTPLAVQTDYWTPTNTDARYPRMAPNSSYGNNDKMSTFWRFDASYCRVKYIQLGYTFDQMGLKKIGISNIRLYANVQNPFTFTKENLIDPEGRGQMDSYPIVKTYSFGLSINL